MKKLIPDDLRVSNFLADFHFWVNDSFKVVEKILKGFFFSVSGVSVSVSFG